MTAPAHAATAPSRRDAVARASRTLVSRAGRGIGSALRGRRARGAILFLVLVGIPTLFGIGVHVCYRWAVTYYGGNFIAAREKMEFRTAATAVAERAARIQAQAGGQPLDYRWDKPDGRNAARGYLVTDRGPVPVPEAHGSIGGRKPAAGLLRTSGATVVMYLRGVNGSDCVGLSLWLSPYARDRLRIAAVDPAGVRDTDDVAAADALVARSQWRAAGPALEGCPSEEPYASLLLRFDGAGDVP